MLQTTIEKIKTRERALISPRKRILIWKKAKGMWQHRKKDPIRKLNEIRKEWNRK